MHKKKILLTIGLIIFIDNIGSGILMPILPTLFMNSSIGLVGETSLEVKSFYFGLSYILFPIIAIFSNPYLGYLSDYKGRKFLIIVGMIGFIITNFVTIFSIITHNLWLFLFTRLVLGFFAGSYTAANAALMDISDNEQEKMKNIKLITLISILGFIISPAFSVLIPTKLTSFSLTIPFCIVFLLSILNLILILLFFPTNNKNIHDTSRPKILKMLFTSFSFIFRDKIIFKKSLTFFLFQVGYNFYFQIIALNLQQIHNFSISSTGLFFFIMGLCYTFGMYIVHPFLSRYYSNKFVINFSLIFSSLVIIANEMNYFNNSKNNLLWLFNILFFIIIPASSINLFKEFIGTDKKNQGLIMGAAGQITSLALITSAVLISFHYYLKGFELLITSFIMFIVFILHVKLNKTKLPI